MCESCENGMEHVLEKEQRMLKEHGWITHFVPGDNEFPYEMNIHTHGMHENLGHLDLQICLGMPPQTAHSILSNAVRSVKSGKKFEHGKRYGELITNFDVLFLEAEEGGRKVLRMIFPDKKGDYYGDLSEQTKGCKPE